MKTFSRLSYFAWVLALALTACVPMDNPLPTVIPTLTSEPPTVTLPAPTETLAPVATETVVPTETPTTLPIDTPTVTPEPHLWRIWFRGVSCEVFPACGSYFDAPWAYFSILSDGSGLEALETYTTTDFLPMPENIPVPTPYPPTFFAPAPSQLSPDGLQYLYHGSDSVLYLTDVATHQANVIYQPDPLPDGRAYLGTTCWSPDGSLIKFWVGGRVGIEWDPPIAYAIRPDGQNLTELFSLPSLELAGSGDCSPDNQTFVTPIAAHQDKTKMGLYIVNWATGQWQQILANYAIDKVRAAPAEFQP